MTSSIESPTTAPALIQCMTAFRDITAYLAESANYKLNNLSAHSYCAFLDDDSDYIPAAIDMLRELSLALTDDNPDIACAALILAITRDDALTTDSSITYSELPLDAPCDLPINYDD